MVKSVNDRSGVTLLKILTFKYFFQLGWVAGVKVFTINVEMETVTRRKIEFVKGF